MFWKQDSYISTVMFPMIILRGKVCFRSWWWDCLWVTSGVFHMHVAKCKQIKYKVCKLHLHTSHNIDVNKLIGISLDLQLHTAWFIHTMYVQCCTLWLWVTMYVQIEQVQVGVPRPTSWNYKIKRQIVELFIMVGRWGDWNLIWWLTLEISVPPPPAFTDQTNL